MVRHETGFSVEAVSLVRLAGLAQGTRVGDAWGRGAGGAAGPRRPVVDQGGALRDDRGRGAVGARGRGADRAGRPGRGTPCARNGRGAGDAVWVKGQTKPYEARLLVDGRDVTFDEAKPMMVWTLVFPTPQVVRAEGWRSAC
jgi:hypothetical protein